jgi:hypothetical protein
MDGDVVKKTEKIQTSADREWWQNYKSDCFQLYTMTNPINIATIHVESIGLRPLVQEIRG